MHSNNTSKNTAKKAVLRKALVRVATHLNLKQKELGEIIEISPSEISRLFAGTRSISPTSKEGECALLLIRIYQSLEALLGEDERQIQE